MDFGIGEAALLGAALGGGLGGATGGGRGALMGAGLGGLTGGLGGTAGGLGAGSIGSSLGLGGEALIGPLLENGAFLSSGAAPGAGGGLLSGITKVADATKPAMTLAGLLGGGGQERPKIVPPPLNSFAGPPGLNTQQGVGNPSSFLVSSPTGPAPGTVAGQTPMAPPVMAGGPLSLEQLALLKRLGLV